MMCFTKCLQKLKICMIQKESSHQLSILTLKTFLSAMLRFEMLSIFVDFICRVCKIETYCHKEKKEMIYNLE